MVQYTIGLDFGTLSGRALLVRTSDGCEMGSVTYDYPHAVMDAVLDAPGGPIRLPQNWALQHPQDYLDVLAHTIPALLAQYGVDAADVIGLGVDFTTCTVIPTTSDGTPLCFDPAYENEPHAYVKLWKHHAAQAHAERLNAIAEARHEPWLADYGGKISSEWLFPKIWQTLDEAPHIYDAADCFIDAGDWIVWQLTGNLTRNSCMVGYKAIYGAHGYPSPDFFAALDERLRHVVRDKLKGPVIPVGTRAGYLTDAAAAITHLQPGTPVTAANADAHCAAPAVKVTTPGKMFLIMGTSACHMLLSDRYTTVPGICGVVKDGMIPGLYGYEAGQGCCGDHFAWFTEHFTTPDVLAEAEEKGIPPIRVFAQRMASLKPGESGLIALDWWNGNRCPLVDYDLTGMIVGMTLQTTPTELFRALVEATAYGTRMIIEKYRQHDIPVDSLIASGGIARKDPVTMQIYADVLGMDIAIAGSSQGPALGSAIAAAAIADPQHGGYATMQEAADAMGSVSDVTYHPNPAHTKIYDRLYREYCALHTYFGEGGNNVMKRLRSLKDAARS